MFFAQASVLHYPVPTTPRLAVRNNRVNINNTNGWWAHA